MSAEVLIAGGGIGGLAAALACRRSGWEVRVCEQAEAFSEVGAGIQLGPNATHILREWGLLDTPLSGQFGRPERLCVRDADTGAELGVMRLGAEIERRYGAPYYTVHRADLQAALLQAATAAGARTHTGSRIESVALRDDGVEATLADGRQIEGDVLVAADGLWSRVREQLLADGSPQPAGDLAYRGMVRQSDLPQHLRSAEVTVWLGERLHAVAYPVRGGEWLNVVCVVEGRIDGDPRSWDHAAVSSELLAAIGGTCRGLREVVQSVPFWRLWVLNARAPVASAREMAVGRVALLGDAAHPMRPYLAQGACMALEDARELQTVLHAVGEKSMDVPTALQRYALNRWERCARVQKRSRRNGWIFHATGPLRWGRDLSMKLLGERLLDVPWLYSRA